MVVMSTHNQIAMMAMSTPTLKDPTTIMMMAIVSCSRWGAHVCLGHCQRFTMATIMAMTLVHRKSMMCLLQKTSFVSLQGLQTTRVANAVHVHHNPLPIARLWELQWKVGTCSLET